MNNTAAREPAEKPIRLLVLGLGNVLLGDDGLGAAAVARVERDYRIPPGVQLEDGGTLGLSLLGLLAESEHVILVDAVRTGKRPGTMVRIDGEEVMDAVRERLSPHQVGVADVLDVVRLLDYYPSSVTLLGLEPDRIELSVVRSSAVEAGLDTLVDAVIHEIRNRGHAMLRKTGPERQRHHSRDLARWFGI